jgi:hypothetical protein
MCRRIEGWIERAMELTLGTGVSPAIRETHHLTQDASVAPQPFCRYTATWGEAKS